MNKKKERKDPAYLREQGNREARGAKQRKITFSFIKHIKGEGESYEEWEACGLLSVLLHMMKHIGNYSPIEVRQKKLIKEYKKFPDHSKFNCPKHVGDVVWAVMHITQNSKEVVVGYIDDDVFYIIFLDKDHKFWPTELRNT